MRGIIRVEVRHHRAEVHSFDLVPINSRLGVLYWSKNVQDVHASRCELVFAAWSRELDYIV